MTEYELFCSESDDDKDQEPKSKKSYTHILSDRVIKQGMPIFMYLLLYLFYCYHCNTYLLCLIIVGYTLLIMSMCIECGNKFCTYKPGKDCLLPNGNVECHQEPQLK